MAELKLCINSRKYTRKLVTETHNTIGTFHSLPPNDKNLLKSKLNDFLASLKDLDSKIQQSQWGQDSDVPETEAKAKASEVSLNKELELCESYRDKIRQCLSQLSVVNAPVQASAETAPNCTFT